MFKFFRIAILLFVLSSVASTLLLQRNIVRDWNGALDIRIIPVIADQKDLTAQYVESLSEKDFTDISKYLVVQAKRYDLNLQSSFNVKLEDAINDLPPPVPSNQASRFDIALWSLKLKWWSWRNQLNDHHVSQIRLYILYQTPNDSQPLPHSTGLRNGLIGLVNARTQKQQRTLHPIIITHELLHIFGASDKYDISSGKPFFPDGFVEPQKKPIYPQRFAEIMARAIPVSEKRFNVVPRLSQTRIGAKTAQEIGWLKLSDSAK